LYAVVSVAQDAAVGAVTGAGDGVPRPSARATIAGASVEVLTYLFPTAVTEIAAELAAQQGEGTTLTAEHP
jgi:hypothetical protein